MANADNEAAQPIIIKKVQGDGHGHHGGAWKVAYADFVTAMMAFFLLMWLLNVTTKEEKNAISNYFDPTHPRVSSELSGSGGILGGLSMSPDGAQVSTVQDIATPSAPVTPRSGMAKGDQRDQMGTSEYEGDTFDPTMDGNEASDTNKTASKEKDGNDLSDGLNVFEELQNIEQAELEQLEALIQQAENENFEGIKQKIIEEIEKSPKLADLMDNLMIDITPEGLRIQIIDNEGRSMFPIGSANMFGFMKELVAKVTQIIIPQTNQISVRGHTDGKPYPDGAKYNNWNLSSDRAIASQRAMLDSGLEIDRVENVVGKADREHLLPDDPLSPRNRRISVILLRQKLENADEIRKAAADAIRQKQEKIEAEQEDRQDIPQLDRTTPPASVDIESDSDSQDSGESADETVLESDPIAEEIRKFEEQKQRRRRSPELSAPPASSPSNNNDVQVLEF